MSDTHTHTHTKGNLEERFFFFNKLGWVMILDSLTMQLLAIFIIGFGVWMSTHDDNCRRSLTLPVLGLGALVLLMWVPCLIYLCLSLFLIYPPFWFLFQALLIDWQIPYFKQFFRSIIGFLGAWKNNSILLWIVSFPHNTADIILRQFVLLFSLFHFSVFGYLDLP